ncbi:hypothetical protein [Botrimarina sp.]|uniref:hypothetical protein n=1 Tax=Botrimarina sp. TaxID=2795802 RepID=UPI0032EC51F7
MDSDHEVKLRLRRKATCPHCWSEFTPQSVLWVATHPDLTGDAVLGDHEPLRFTPTRFNAKAVALDARGTECHELACPRCHLVVPRATLQMAPLIVSIAGTPSSGKSYFLAALAWSMRRKLPELFRLTFAEADPQANAILNSYEQQQFLNPNRNAIVRLAKTEEQGDLYSTVQLDGSVVQLPRPFLFAVRPGEGHPSRKRATKLERLLCLYDNAGESFLPGKDTAANRSTGHLTDSHAVVAVYDPTQDVRFREAYQKAGRRAAAADDVASRQETVLHEIATRLERRQGLGKTQNRPLIVALTKYDQWWPLLGAERLPEPWTLAGDTGAHALHLGKVEHVSDAVRDVLKRISPEFVAAADDLSDQVWYVPISATGCSPERDKDSGRLGFRPCRVDPMWEAVPLLTILALTTGGLVPTVNRPLRLAKPESDADEQEGAA